MDTAEASPIDRLRDPLADPVYDRNRIRLALMLVFMGVAHFVVPGPFRRIVPGWFPWPAEAVAVSGATELASGLMMLDRRTRRAGGALATATLVAVYPANVQMALDTLRPVGEKRSRLAAVALWLRLPLQIPMLSTALRVARGR